MPRRSLGNFSLAVAFCLSAQVACGFQQDVDASRSHFHNAEANLMLGRIPEAMREYASVLQSSRTLDIELREWYLGCSYYGLTICAALNSDTLGTRHFLASAFEHFYWMFPAVRTSVVIVSVAGPDYVDSLIDFWASVGIEQQSRWRHPDPIVITPKPAGNQPVVKTIIAFHGGNGNLSEFVTHWQNVADALNANVVIPAGCVRLSPVSYSWGYKMEPIDSVFQNILHRRDLVPNINQTQIYLVGFSQGGHAALGLALRHPDIVHGAVIIEGFNLDSIDNALAAKLRRYTTGICGIFGELGENIFRVSYDGFREQCDKMGIPTKFETVPGMVHELPADLSQRLRGCVDWIEGRRAVSSGRSQTTGGE